MSILMIYYDPDGGLNHLPLDMERASPILCRIVSHALVTAEKYLDLSLPQYFTPEVQDAIRAEKGLEPDAELDLLDIFEEYIVGCRAYPPYSITDEITIYAEDGGL